MNNEARNRQIVRFNIAGLLISLFLGVSKMIVGRMTNAHAIFADGINSLSDMLASFVSILTTVFLNKGSDKKHPMGYGRLEYLASFAVTLVVIYIGFATIISTIRIIVRRQIVPSYSNVSVMVMFVSLFMRLVYGVTARRKGRKLNSTGLIMSSTDSLADALVSFAVIASMGIYASTGISIEQYLCVAISVMVIFTGIRMTLECMNKILGTRIDPEYRRKIIGLITQEDEVLNVSNLVIHNYGENVYVGSLDIEVDERLSANAISKLSRRLKRKAEEMGMVLTSVGISAANISDPKASIMWDSIIEIARKYPGIIRVHSFTVDLDEKDISFYVVLDYARSDREEDLEKFSKEIRKKFKDMNVDIYSGIDM